MWHPKPDRFERLDLLCKHTHQPRSGLVGHAFDFLDAALTLGELARVEAEHGGLTDAQQQVREQATSDMAAILDRLTPVPIIPAASLN